VPVQKFRSAEEMNATPVAGAPASDFTRFLRHCARFRLISPKRYPSGVFKFRNLPEAQAGRESLRRIEVRDERLGDISPSSPPSGDPHPR
jgi:hypothetical protein